MLKRVEEIHASRCASPIESLGESHRGRRSNLSFGSLGTDGMWIMGDWFLNLPIPWMTLVIFAATYLVAACVYLVVVRLAVGDRARAFKAFSPGIADYAPD
jgi:branched-subunit amino acid ABC-type transport system permease component